MTLLEALLQRFRDRMMRMRALLDRFDDTSAEREMVGPRWNVRDLVGHYLFWTTEAADRIPDILAAPAATPSKVAPTPIGPDGLPTYDLDRVNETTFKKHRRMSYVMLLPQLRAAEERLLQTLSRLDPKPLVGETPIRQWIDIHLEHYEKHWPGLKAAADRVNEAPRFATPGE